MRIGIWLLLDLIGQGNKDLNADTSREIFEMLLEKEQLEVNHFLNTFHIALP